MIRLTSDQIYFLKIFTGYKAFARKENFLTDQKWLKNQTVSKSYDELALECLKLGLLKADKNGRFSLKLTWEKTRQLMSLQSDTVQDLEKEISERMVSLAEYNATIDRLGPVNPPWPTPDHWTLVEAREQKTYILKILADLNERLNMMRRSA